MINGGDPEGAKARLQAFQQEVRSDKDKGAVLAALGICSSITRAKEGTMQSWDAARLERAARSIVASQFADDFDQGYAEVMIAYSRLTQPTA